MTREACGAASVRVVIEVAYIILARFLLVRSHESYAMAGAVLFLMLRLTLPVGS